MDSKMNQAVEKEHQLLSMDGKEEENKPENYYRGIEKDNY